MHSKKPGFRYMLRVVHAMASGNMLRVAQQVGGGICTQITGFKAQLHITFCLCIISVKLWFE